MTHKLSDREKRFVTNYINSGGNAYQSLIQAGYTHNTANVNAKKILSRPNIGSTIVKAYNSLEKQFDRKLGLTLSWRLKKLKRIIDDIVPDDESKPISRKYAGTAIHALQEVSRLYGDYAPGKILALNVDATREKLHEVRKQYKEY